MPSSVHPATRSRTIAAVVVLCAAGAVLAVLMYTETLSIAPGVRGVSGTRNRGAVSSAQPVATPSTRSSASVSSVESAETLAQDVPAVVRVPVELQDRVDALVSGAMRARKLPGAVVTIGRSDGVVFERAYGLRSVSPSLTRMDTDALFDLASLTKAVATTTAVMRLWDQQRLELDAPVAKTIRAFDTPDKRTITPRMLLTHTSGLPAVTQLGDYEHGAGRAVSAIAASKLVDEPGARYRYSDLGFIVLGELVRAVANRPIAEETQEAIFRPLGMNETRYVPGVKLLGRAVPTEERDGQMLAGAVHDPRAAKLGGVAGHAGVFSTAHDLSRFARMMLGRGELEGVRVLSPRAIDEMLKPQGDSSHPRALGWDMPGPSAGYSHGGFTGTYLWFDPSRDVFLVFLSSRLHPQGKGRVIELSTAIRAAILQSLQTTPFAAPARAGKAVLTGVDVLRSSGFATLNGARVALVANAASRARDGTRTVDLLAHAPNVELVSILSPEHGLDAKGDDAIDDSIDSVTGIAIHSLYGARYRPGAEALRGANTIVFDLQDAGARFYTYLGTMRFCLEAASHAKRRFVVLDRPNPGGGDAVEGPMPEPLPNTLLQPLAIPVRHGMTFGELARLAVADLRLDVSLDVIAMQGWARWMRFDDTGLPWTAPSPNLRDADAALLYPGIAWFETTNVSVGRGTSEPFHLVGAPWMDGRLAARLSKAPHEGVDIETAEFTPAASEHAGVRCRGIRIRVKDRAVVRPVRLAWEIARAVDELYAGSWSRTGFVTLASSEPVTKAWGQGSAIEALAERDEASFVERRRGFFGYQ